MGESLEIIFIQCMVYPSILFRDMSRFVYFGGDLKIEGSRRQRSSQATVSGTWVGC